MADPKPSLFRQSSAAPASSTPPASAPPALPARLDFIGTATTKGGAVYFGEFREGDLGVVMVTVPTAAGDVRTIRHLARAQIASIRELDVPTVRKLAKIGPHVLSQFDAARIAPPPAPAEPVVETPAPPRRTRARPDGLILRTCPAPTMDALENHRLITHVRDDIQAWATKHNVGFYASLASTTRRALELLATPPNGLFVIVVWEGEDAGVGETAYSQIAEQTIVVFVMLQQSLSVRPGQDIMERGPNGAPGLLELVNEIRDRVRGLRFPAGAVDEVIWYRGAEQVFDPQDVPVPLNAFRLRFTLRTFMPEPAAHIWQRPT